MRPAGGGGYTPPTNPTPTPAPVPTPAPAPELAPAAGGSSSDSESSSSSDSGKTPGGARGVSYGQESGGSSASRGIDFGGGGFGFGGFSPSPAMSGGYESNPVAGAGAVNPAPHGEVATGGVTLTPENKAEFRQAMNDIISTVSERTQLSSTGYQTAMARLNNPTAPDKPGGMTLDRAMEYDQAAKERFSDPDGPGPLSGLAQMQRDYINRTESGELKSPIEMSVDELSVALNKSRECGFANCDLQALETANQLFHILGIQDFDIMSNEAMSHNYVTLQPSEAFPKGGMVDPWLGGEVQDLSEGNIFQQMALKRNYKHQEVNLSPNDVMKQWVQERGQDFVIR